MPGDLEINETGGYDRSLKLCFQQSAGNSTRPQINLTFGTLWNCFLYQDIANLQAPARLEHPCHLPQCDSIMAGRHAVERRSPDDDVETLVTKWKLNTTSGQAGRVRSRGNVRQGTAPGPVRGVPRYRARSTQSAPRPVRSSTIVPAAIWPWARSHCSTSAGTIR